MKPYEHVTRDSGSHRCLLTRTDGPYGWSWWIGDGVVTTAELESWQLGPDLTETFAAETADIDELL